jgi:hypothetical protein
VDCAPAEQALRGRVQRVDPCLGVDRHQAGPGAVDDRADACLVRLEGDLGLSFEALPLAVGRLALGDEQCGRDQRGKDHHGQQRGTAHLHADWLERGQRVDGPAGRRHLHAAHQVAGLFDAFRAVAEGVVEGGLA